jgi:hypothetical protein
MNQQLQDFARATIKEGLAKLPSGWQNKFWLMYGEVDEMPPEKLDWAMTQVANSLRKYEKMGAGTLLGAGAHINLN